MNADPLGVSTTGLAAFPDEYAASDPDRPAYIMAGTGHVVTYRQLVSASRDIAALLWSRGLRHGDCVAILMENSETFLQVAWAAQRIGLRYVGLPTRLRPAEAAVRARCCVLAVIQVAHSTPTTVRLRSRIWFMGRLAMRPLAKPWEDRPARALPSARLGGRPVRFLGFPPCRAALVRLVRVVMRGRDRTSAASAGR